MITFLVKIEIELNFFQTSAQYLGSMAFALPMLSLLQSPVVNTQDTLFEDTTGV